jgi:hypothetical protein
MFSVLECVLECEYFCIAPSLFKLFILPEGVGT